MFNLKYIYIIGLLFSIATGCQKEIRYETATDQLANKVWHLEKIVTPVNSFSYSGVPTFSFKLEASTNRYRDSDGIVGDFTIEELSQGVWIHVNSAARLIESYKVVQLEKNHFVTEIVKNNVVQVLYFSTRP